MCPVTENRKSNFHEISDNYGRFARIIWERTPGIETRKRVSVHFIHTPLYSITLSQSFCFIGLILRNIRRLCTLLWRVPLLIYNIFSFFARAVGVKPTFYWQCSQKTNRRHLVNTSISFTTHLVPLESLSFQNSSKERKIFWSRLRHLTRKTGTSFARSRGLYLGGGHVEEYFGPFSVTYFPSLLSKFSFYLFSALSWTNGKLCLLYRWYPPPSGLQSAPLRYLAFWLRPRWF